MGTILQIKNLTVDFDTEDGIVHAVKEVDLSLMGGEILALVGESGSGKTVLCKTMLQILGNKAAVRGGEILLEGHNILAHTDREMEKIRGKDISMIFQDPMTSLNPTISIGKQIMEAVLLHEKLSAADARRRTVELLELVGLSHAEKRFKQFPHHFSGGMRQRVAIAIAIACRPKVLLADEPTTALDQQTQMQMIALLKNIQCQTGIAVIFITHDLSLVENIADRAAVMYHGEIVEISSVLEIFAAPKHEYTKRLLGYLNYGKGVGHTHGKIHFHNGVAHTHTPNGEHMHELVEEDLSFPYENSQKLVRIKNLCKDFRLDRHIISKVLNDVSFDIYKGEILGLVGPSGCGKSTLARCLMGIYSATSGAFEYLGDTEHPYKKQMIFQDSASALNPRMTLEQIIAEPLVIKKLCRNKEEIKQRVYEAMDQAELDKSLAGRHPYDVSGGQRQRAAIARAISVDPELIVADEPISSLDISIQAQIVHLFKKLQESRGLTILLIAHDLPMVEHVSDRIIHL